MIGLAIRGRRVLTRGGFRPAAVLIAEERIVDVVGRDEVPAGAPVRECGELAVIPALVDAHADGERPEAAAGGVGTVVDAPRGRPPAAASRAALEARLAAAKGRLVVDAAFWGGLAPEGSGAELAALARAGVAGFRRVVSASGRDESSGAARAGLEAAMAAIADLGLPLVASAETGALERSAVRLMIELCRGTRCRVHIAPLSCAEALEDVERAKAEGLPLTVEVCPRDLTFCAEEASPEDVPVEGEPPPRSAENREALWRGLARGVVDFVASDRSPATAAGLRLALPATWSGAKRRGFGLEDVARWTAEGPAAFLGLGGKGRLEKGRDADLAILDDAELFDVPWGAATPYRGRRLPGVVEATYLRGLPVHDPGRPVAPPRGRVLLRGAPGWAG